MRTTKTLNSIVFIAALAALALLVTSPISAKPGWSHPVLGDLTLSSEQQEQISNLRSAFRDQFKSLDWSVEEGGHAPETLQQARELRMALREEIRDVLTDEQREAMDSARRGCPHHGKAAPSRVDPSPTRTLFL